MSFKRFNVASQRFAAQVINLFSVSDSFANTHEFGEPDTQRACRFLSVVWTHSGHACLVRCFMASSILHGSNAIWPCCLASCCEKATSFSGAVFDNSIVTRTMHQKGCHVLNCSCLVLSSGYFSNLLYRLL